MAYKLIAPPAESTNPNTTMALPVPSFVVFESQVLCVRFESRFFSHTGLATLCNVMLGFLYGEDVRGRGGLCAGCARA